MARALAKAPEDRYPSAGDLGRAALAAARGRVGHGVRAQRRGRAGRAGRAHQRARRARRPRSPRRAAAHAGAGGGDDGAAAAPPAPRSLAGAVLAVAAAGSAVALIGLPGGSSGNDRARAPLSADEVRDVAQDFAQAYEDEDGQALGRLLTRDVQRVLPSGVARGRTRVVREYRSQFRAQDTQHYSSTTSRSRPAGRVARAAATASSARTATRSRAGSCSAWSATAASRASA